MSQASPKAVHDVLVVVGRLQDVGFLVAPAEVHCFAYLACAAWLSDGGSLRDWGYDFVAVDSTRPFAADLDAAIRQAGSSGLIERQREILKMTEAGTVVSEGLDGTIADEGRRQYLAAACDVSAAVSIPTALGALAMEPQLQRSFQLESDRHLFDQLGRRLTVDEVRELDLALPEDSGLLARMVLWVSYWADLRDRSDDAVVNNR